MASRQSLDITVVVRESANSFAKDLDKTFGSQSTVCGWMISKSASVEVIELGKTATPAWRSLQPVVLSLILFHPSAIWLRRMEGKQCFTPIIVFLQCAAGFAAR